jgi:hypothetical protein
LSSALALIGSPTSNGAGVTDRLICGPSALRPCRAAETLTTTETIQGGRPVALSATARRKSRAVIVATKTVIIQPGNKVTVTLTLNATGCKLLARSSSAGTPRCRAEPDASFRPASVRERDDRNDERARRCQRGRTSASA